MGYGADDGDFVFDMIDSIKKIIKSNYILEAFARRLYAIIPYRIRKLNREFYDFYNLLLNNETENIKYIEKYQFESLKHIVGIAYYKTTFYKQKYDSAGFHPSMLNEISDLKKIPILTKDEIRNNSKEMVRRDVSIAHLKKAYTSGTTGKTLEIYEDNKTRLRELASILYQWKRIGYVPGDGRIEFRGFVDGNKDFIFLPDERVLRINIIKMDIHNIDILIKRILKIGYNFIHGYPSAIVKFAKLLKESEIHYQPKGIMLASEVLYDWQMSIIDEVFHCQKISHYGQTEKVALGAWNNDRLYHFIPTYGIFETDYENKIIATGFINEVMPIIRYQMSDVAEGILSSSNDALYPVIKDIIGRQEDYTYNENGDLIPPAVVTFPFKHLFYINAAKIIQYELKLFDLVLEVKDQKVLLDKRFKEEVDTLVVDLKKIYGQSIDINIRYVDRIDFISNGKFRWIENRIKNYE